MITLAPPAQTTDTSKHKWLQPISHSLVAFFNSVRLGVSLLVLLAITVLIGAWCPQEAQVGQEKVVEMFGPDMALTLHKMSITDIFHSPWFLILIAFISFNMVTVSFKRVFPKALKLKQPLPFLSSDAIGKLPVSDHLELKISPAKALKLLKQKLQKKGYTVQQQGESLTAEFGTFGRLAASVTHVGLLTLLTGVTITSWTGFSGFQPVPVGGDLNFHLSEHSKLWIGKLPTWKVHVDASRKEEYVTGEPKQWYSDLSVIDKNNTVVTKQQISVNTPLSYEGVDVYQSSWALDAIEISFNGHKRKLNLRPMGKIHAAFLPLEPGIILIFSVANQEKPLRVFGKTPDWDSPRLLTQISPGKSAKLGNVEITYNKAIPITGLQYKCDPGLPVTFVAFGFIIAGVLLASVPYKQIWAYSSASGLLNMTNSLPAGKENKDKENTCILFLGGRSAKAKRTFELSLKNIAEEINREVKKQPHA